MYSIIMTNFSMGKAVCTIIIAFPFILIVGFLIRACCQQQHIKLKIALVLVKLSLQVTKVFLFFHLWLSQTSLVFLGYMIPGRVLNFTMTSPEFRWGTVEATYVLFSRSRISCLGVPTSSVTPSVFEPNKSSSRLRPEDVIKANTDAGYSIDIPNGEALPLFLVYSNTFQEMLIMQILPTIQEENDWVM